MNEAQLVSTGAWIIATLVSVLIVLLGWLGSKIYQSLDRMNDKVQEISDVLHGRITDLDRRVTRVEAHVAHVNTFAQGRPQWPPAMGK